ncbi:Transcriptional regulatory protein TyrR [Sodalis glossinidius str. 'morsitans']|uniref:HTH-type transcriptional regulatory protein TyrR n=1 Tax=Sodalis glossinidius (strain morsitans) TaxID=343509 RepID=Q2NSV1_SODGM|nr:transcriptional regulator TyrR [Sodalis glossinidius]BAE74774.1 transcriptional regulator [Sodalis glossinidius str. 'morsitans']CRL45568.1 Transcriptional regulatory protein TyrR [Sodalis glossinidius str. 'morsitans']
MRLEVVCQDRLGLVRELLDLLVSRSIDLRGIEITPTGRVYLNCTPLEFDLFRSLMAEIRRIEGVTDVRTVAFMPTERDSRAMQAILSAMPEAVLSIDLKGRIALSNPAAALLFNASGEKLLGQSLSALVGGFDFNRWLEDALPQPAAERVVIQGQDFLLDITPVQLPGDDGHTATVGGVVMLKSALCMDRQLKDHSVNDDNAFSHLLASSERMRQVINNARKLAMLDAPLLIIGETGTGKDLLSHACHLRSARGRQPFLALNCAALPDEVAESELFGHAAGAYPNALESKKGFFEQADGGSVLLDEIAEMSPRMQNKLLRFLNDGTFRRVGEDKEMHVDVRVICATQKNLLELVRDGHFREDLYYRLNVLTLAIPPLRDRPEDIMPLTSLFVARFCDEQGVTRPQLAPDLAAKLTRYPWPGNVRQLKNALYRAMAQREGPALSAVDIDLPDFGQALPLTDDLLDGSLDDISKRFERSVLTRLYRAYPSTRKLAKRLGVSHTAIANKLREYGLNGKKTDDDTTV